VLNNPLGPTDPTGVIWGGDLMTASCSACAMCQRSSGPNPDDAGGCEDPPVRGEGGNYLVFYTGVDAARRRVAARRQGAGTDRASRAARHAQGAEKRRHIKEATLARGSDGQYRLFYEYAKDGASRIGMAVGQSVEGPWTVVDDPFPIREDAWDNWHLSTGPIVQEDGRDPVMFYNGATVDARWRIGWVSLRPTSAMSPAAASNPS
jgi:predicted GH43/DUF377 family glycosyl hydrolase